MELIRSKPKSLFFPIEIDHNYLRRVVNDLSFPRPIGTPENEQAKQIVIQEFDAIFGSHTLVGKWENVVHGDLEKARVLIGAHFDSVPDSPGADDNASAVAVMLAAGKKIKEAGIKDIAFAAFNSEEFGLAGSAEIAEATKNKKLQVHVLEMVGFTNREPNSQKNPLPFLEGCPTVADFLGVVGNDSNMVKHIVDSAGAVATPVIGFAIPKELKVHTIRQISPHLLRSDHTNFWENDFSATMWTDTSDFRSGNYHQITDTPETLDYEFMADVAKVLVVCCL